MTPGRWATVERLYHQALLQDVGERAAFLTAACAGDDALRQDVESLLEHDGGAGFLSTPAAAQLEPAGSSPNALIGRSVGPYVVSGRLGAGGMGEVYRARDQKLGRDVALKILPPALRTIPTGWQGSRAKPGRWPLSTVRWAGAHKVSLDEALVIQNGISPDFVALDVALTREMEGRRHDDA
jgi:serine/threonine protein kinase